MSGVPWVWPPFVQEPATGIDSGGTELTIGAIPDGFLLQRVGTTIVGIDPQSLSPSSERWALPAVAHPSDEEFRTSSLANFTLYDSTGAVVAGQPVDNVIDPYTNDVTNHHADANVKRSWLRLKIRNNNSRFYFMKLRSPGTNELFKTRAGIRSRPPGVGANDEVDVGLVLMAQSAGAPDPNNRIEILKINVGASGRKFVARSVVAGVATDVWNATAGFSPEEETMPAYLYVHKLAGVYHFWLGQGETDLSHLGSAANALTIVYAGFLGICNSGTPGNGWLEADFIRFLNTATFIE